MTNAVKALPAKAGEKNQKQEGVVLQPVAEVLFLGDVAVDLIDVVSNVRKKFDEHALKELAANIKQLGRVISPITLRPATKAGRYELVAGERRLRGAKIAGLPKISAQVLALNDLQALEYQAAENIHRKDLTPIEEARAFQTMLKARNEKGEKRFTVDDLAKIVDKSVVYIYRAVSLLELPPEVIDAIEIGRLTPAHGHQILRVPKDKRAKFCGIALRDRNDTVNDDVGGSKSIAIGSITAKELQVQIDSEVGRSLAKAQFMKDIPYAGEVACAGCPNNAANHGMLFDGATEGRCLSKPCFDKKTEQFYLDLQAEGKKRWPAVDFLGRGEQNYYKKRTMEGLTGNAMLSTEEQNHPVIKKLLAEKPHKLGYAVVLPMKSSYGENKKWEKARLVLAVTDPALIGGMSAEKIVDCTKPAKSKKSTTSSGASSASSTPRPPDPKTEFVSAFLENAINAAIGAKALTFKPTIEDWRRLAEIAADQLDENLIAGIFKKPVEDYSQADLRKASEEQLRAVALLDARTPNGVSDSEIKALGVDVVAVRKAAKVVAEKKWAEQESKQDKKELAAGKPKA